MAFQEDINFSKAKYFLDNYFGDKLTIEDFIVKEVKDVHYISNNKELKKICTDSIKICILGLLDGRPLDQSIIDFEKHITALEQVNTKLTNNMEIGWVNATCQNNFANELNIQIEHLPSLVAYIPQHEKYAVMFSSFEADNISIFVDNIIQGKVPLSDFNKEKMYLRNAINCLTLQNEEIHSTDEEDEKIIKELVEESKRKREEFENQRAKELSHKDSKKKKKKQTEKVDL